MMCKIPARNLISFCGEEEVQVFGEEEDDVLPKISLLICQRAGCQ